MATTTSSPGHWLWLLFLGLLLILVGIFAIASPFFATLISLVILGWMLIFSGAVQTFYAFSTFRAGSFLTHLLLGILSVLLGLLIITQPAAAAVSFTLLIAFFFLAVGLFRIFSALFQRFESWGWVLLGGLIDVVLGILILIHWPSSALWIIGLFVGIDFIFVGWAFVTGAWLVRNQVTLVTS